MTVPDAPVDVVVNGRPMAVDPGATVAAVVARLGHDPRGRGVAVAVDGDVVPRGEWDRRPVHAGARIEVLRAVGGGAR